VDVLGRYVDVLAAAVVEELGLPLGRVEDDGVVGELDEGEGEGEEIGMLLDGAGRVLDA
jgi:hypothetical protein